MCEPIGKWVKPVHEGATGREKKEVGDTLLRRK
jgi:hypothetical protein